MLAKEEAEGGWQEPLDMGRWALGGGGPPVPGTQDRDGGCGLGTGAADLERSGRGIS